MKRLFGPGFIVVLAGIGAAAGTFHWYVSADRVADGPSAFIPGAAGTGACEGFYLGSGKPGDVLSGTLEISNRGSKPLNFELRSGCSCAKLTPVAGTVAPGKTQQVLIEVTLRRRGQDEDFNVLVSTNDPKQSALNCEFIAKCPALVRVSPKRIDFGNLAFGQGASATVHVACEKPIEFAVAHSELAVTKNGTRRGGIELLVSLKSSVPVGIFSECLELHVVGEEETVLVPISANVCKTIVAAPRSIILPPGGDDISPQRISCLVWRFDGRRLGNLIHIESPSWLNVRDTSTADEFRRRIEFQMIGEQPASIETTVRLFFADADDPADILIRTP